MPAKRSCKDGGTRRKVGTNGEIHDKKSRVTSFQISHVVDEGISHKLESDQRPTGRGPPSWVP
eukprot:12426169-Karenia_brevis.AAC.1